MARMPIIGRSIAVGHMAILRRHIVVVAADVGDIKKGFLRLDHAREIGVREALERDLLLPLKIMPKELAAEDQNGRWQASHPHQALLRPQTRHQLPSPISAASVPLTSVATSSPNRSRLNYLDLTMNRFMGSMTEQIFAGWRGGIRLCCFCSKCTERTTKILSAVR